MTDQLEHWVCGHCHQDTAATHFYVDQSGVSQHASPYQQQMMREHADGGHYTMAVRACPSCQPVLVHPLNGATPRQCPHGYHHPDAPHSCDGCWCEGERDRRDYGWPHDTTPKP